MLSFLAPDPTDLSAPEWGDERERASVLAAYTRGFLLSTCAAYALAIALALFGHVIFAVAALVLVASGPAFVVMADARRRGVDLYALAAQATRGRQAFELGLLTVVLVTVFGATLVLALTGHAVLPTPQLPASVLLGMCGGGLMGLALGVVGYRKSLTEAARRRELDDAADDD